MYIVVRKKWHSMAEVTDGDDFVRSLTLSAVLCDERCKIDVVGHALVKSDAAMRKVACCGSELFSTCMCIYYVCVLKLQFVVLNELFFYLLTIKCCVTLRSVLVWKCSSKGPQLAQCGTLGSSHTRTYKTLLDFDVRWLTAIK